MKIRQTCSFVITANSLIYKIISQKRKWKKIIINSVKIFEKWINKKYNENIYSIFELEYYLAKLKENIDKPKDYIKRSPSDFRWEKYIKDTNKYLWYRRMLSRFIFTKEYFIDLKIEEIKRY